MKKKCDLYTQEVRGGQKSYEAEKAVLLTSQIDALKNISPTADKDSRTKSTLLDLTSSRIKLLFCTSKIIGSSRVIF